MGKEKNEMLEMIFKAREEELSIIDEQDKRFMNQDKANRTKKHNSLNKELERIPYNLNWLKESITKLLEDYIETIDYEGAYFYKKILFSRIKRRNKIKRRTKIETKKQYRFLYCFFVTKSKTYKSLLQNQKAPC